MEGGDAEVYAAALSPDDSRGIETSVEDGELVVRFSYDGLGTALSSLDDALSCLGVAEEVSGCV